MKRPIVPVAGKDPLEEYSGGHSRYVRAHARVSAAGLLSVLSETYAGLGFCA